MEDKNNSDYLDLLRKIRSRPRTSQRKLAQELGFSLGKLNYVLKSLKQKGFVKIKNFQNQKIKLNIFNMLLHPKVYLSELSLQLIL